MACGSRPDLEVVAEAGGVAERHGGGRASDPDVVVLDLELSDGDGTDVDPRAAVDGLDGPRSSC